MSPNIPKRLSNMLALFADAGEAGIENRFVPAGALAEFGMASYIETFGHVSRITDAGRRALPAAPKREG